MTDKKTEALKIALEYAEGALSMFDSAYQRHPATESDRNVILEDITFIKEVLAEQLEQDRAWTRTKENLSQPEVLAVLMRLKDR